MNSKLEVIGFDIESCLYARDAGADRIELCNSPSDGGTTPGYGFIKAARRIKRIELYPMIRPRSGDFLYSDDDFKIMLSDVKLCKDSGCDGVVTGILKGDGTVDKDRCRRIVELAYPLGVTFHRAFDRTRDPFEAMEDIISIGFERILTSGQQLTASEGTGLISKLVREAGERIIIMPGSGVRSSNIEVLATQTKGVEFHSSARMMRVSNMIFVNAQLNETLQQVSIDPDEIKKMKNILSSINN